MKKSFKINGFLLIIALFATILISKCGSDSVTSPGATYDAKSINGTVTFADNHFVTSGGTYLISAYPKTGWPPAAGPTAYDTIHVTSGTLGYNYKLVGLDDGSYVISVGFRKVTGGQSPIMGIYGCDTLHSIQCVITPTLNATITGGAGVGGINFLCWADTSKKLY
jgi:hypothetical protein